jgi:Putative ABC-transporter type IV
VICVRRFLAYGVLGLGTEVVFTSIGRALNTRDPRLVGRTYLWMLPIYGAGGLLLERLHARLLGRRVPPPVRALAVTGAIYTMEYGAGSLLRALLGECPWRYERGVTLGGYVRLDYAPFWYGAALLFEMLQREVRKLDRPRRTPMDRRMRSRSTAPGGDGGGAARQPGEERRRALRRVVDRLAADRVGRRPARAVPSATPAAPAAKASA